ncbi:unnamed protein product [Arabidopsis halleri]
MANLDFKSLEFLTSLTFNFKTVSDTVTSSSYSVSSPVASGDLDLVTGGCFRWRMVSHRECSRYSVKDGINRDGYDTDEDDFDYYDDLDDDYELVKIQRIRKSGKRTFAKSKKKSSYSQLKFGCVYGKHGLGIRFRC